MMVVVVVLARLLLVRQQRMSAAAAAANVGRMADRTAVVAGRLWLLFPLVVGGLLRVVELGLPLGGER